MAKYTQRGGSITSLFKDVFNYIFNNNYLTAIFLIVCIIGLIYLEYKFDPFKIIEKYPSYLFLINGVFVTIIICFYLFIVNYKGLTDKSGYFDYLGDNSFNNALSNFFIKMFALFGIFAGIFVCIFGLYWLVSTTPNINEIVRNFIIIIGIIIALGIIYLLFFKKSATQDTEKTSHFKLFQELIFLIPCYLIDYIEYFEKQIGLTTKPVWILLLMELIIIAMYFIIPVVSKKIVLIKGNEILQGPIYTDVLTQLGPYQGINLDKTIDYNYNYGLAFKIYINPQPESTNVSYTKFTSLLNYANKPNILYNAKKNTLRIICLNGKNDLVTIYETTDIKYQKWIPFLINYSSGTIDVFIDDNLVATINQVLPYMTVDNITCGEDNGIHGGIKDVVYKDNGIHEGIKNVVYKDNTFSEYFQRIFK